jgi:hypothetical protein
MPLLAVDRLHRIRQLGPSNQHAAAFRRLLGLDQQAGFPHSRLAAEQHSLATTALSGLDRPSQHRELSASSNQRQVRAHARIVIQIVTNPQRIKDWPARKKSVWGLLYIRTQLGYASPS